jgi:spermidine/putrescine transport system permease protein
MDPAVSPAGRRALAVFFAGVLCFLYLPFAIAIAASFSADPYVVTVTNETLRWYRAVLDDGELRQALAAGLWVAAAVAAIDVLVAVGLALAFTLPRQAGSRLGRGLLLVGALVPLAVPPSVYAAMMLVLSHGGPYHVPFGLHLVVAAHVAMFLPFAVLIVLPGIHAIGRDLFEMAEDLGAGPGTLILRLVLPLAGPAIVTAFVVVFVFSFNEPVASAWLVDKQPTFAAWLWSFAKLGSSSPITSVISVLGYVVAVAVAVVLRVATAGFGRARRGQVHR